MRNYFIFNGIRSDEYGVYITGGKIFDAPARDFEEIEIAGRDGILTMDRGRFLPIPHVYNAYIHEDFDSNLQGLRNELLAQRGTAILSDTFHPGEFYKAYFEKGFEVDPLMTLRHGSFEIEFTRDPRRFLLSGETVTTLTESGNITNPTKYNSKPLITVYGTGTLGIGSETVTISYADEYTVLDSETQDAYKGTVNCNQYVTMTSDDFPVLPPGNTTFTLGTGITQVVLIPRWYIL